MAIERHVNIEDPVVSFEGMRASWGGIWAGMLGGPGGDVGPQHLGHSSRLPCSSQHRSGEHNRAAQGGGPSQERD
jgi:hypothetical protein